MAVTYRKKDSFSDPVKCASVVIAAYTTCWGRVTLWQAMNRVSGRLVYCDTDSIMFLSEPGLDNLDDVRGSSLGRWTDEIPPGNRLVSFCSPAPKVYSYILDDGSGSGNEVVKAKGFRQSAENAVLNHENFTGLVSVNLSSEFQYSNFVYFSWNT